MTGLPNPFKNKPQSEDQEEFERKLKHDEIERKSQEEMQRREQQAERNAQGQKAYHEEKLRLAEAKGEKRAQGISGAGDRFLGGVGKLMTMDKKLSPRPLHARKGYSGSRKQPRVTRIQPNPQMQQQQPQAFDDRFANLFNLNHPSAQPAQRPMAQTRDFGELTNPDKVFKKKFKW